MRGLLSNPKFALESIDFQGVAFFKELTTIFAAMAKVPAAELPGSELVAMVVKAIHHHTGMEGISVSLDEYEPCVEFPKVDKNNILFNEGVKQWASSADGIRMIASAQDGVARGSVNLKTGKVSGVFAEVPTTIHLPVAAIVAGKVIAEEWAAITLHEVGHILVYFEYISRTITTNQALAGLSKALDKSDSQKQREFALMSVKKALNLQELDVEEVAQSKTKEIAEIVVITQIARAAKSELGSNVYDLSTWEYLADQYAARQGAGRYIVTGLEKLFRAHGDKAFRGTATFLALEALKLAMIFGGLVITATTGGLGGYFAGIVATWGILLAGADSNGDGTYDTPGDRFRRVRNQVVEALKDKKLSKDDHERLEADLVVIDKVLASMSDRQQLFGVLWDFFYFPGQKQIAQKKLQQDLEALAANELFVKAAALRQLA